MSGPFGLAYGIGAGTAGIPDAIIKGREDAQQMALKNMQLEQMRKQMAEEEEAKRIMATPFKGEADRTVTTGGGEMPMAESAPGVSAEAYQQEAGGALNAAIPQSMEIPKQTRTIKAYATPQQKIAAEYRQKAQMLRDKGLWRSAMELEKNAETYDEHHSKASRKGLADAISMGQEDRALEYIHGMGGTGVVGVAPMASGGLLLTVQDPNGQTHDVPLSKEQYTGLISGQDPATIINQAASQMYRDRSLGQRGEQFDRTFDQRGTQFAQRQVLEREKLQQRRDHDTMMERIKKDYPQSTTAMQKNTAYYARLANIPESEAVGYFVPGAGRKDITNSQRESGLQRVNASILKAYDGIPDPDSGDEQERTDAKLYRANLKAIGELLAKPAEKPKTEKKTEQPAEKRGPSGPDGKWALGDVSYDGKNKLVEGKGWVSTGSN